MEESIFEGTIDGHAVRVAIGPLVAWERLAAIETAALTTMLLALAVVTWIRIGDPSRRALAALGPLAGGACALAAFFTREPDGVTGFGANVFAIFPSLGSRVVGVGVGPRVMVWCASGVLAAVLVDVPAWRGRPKRQVARLGVLALPLVVALAALHASADVRAFRAEVAAIRPLPHVAFEDALALHVGQRRAVTPSEVTQLAVRSLPNMLIFVPGARFITSEAGTPVDAAHLAAHEWWRVSMEEADAQAWSASTVEVVAPSSPGAFVVSAHFERGPVRVSRDLDALAISDAPDPLFPLTVGMERRFARSRRVRGGDLVALAPLTLRVDDEALVDGFRVLRVSLREGETVLRTDTVVPWEGTYRMSARSDAPPFIERAATSDPSDPSGDVLGATCLLLSFDRLPSCECATEPPAGPRRCTFVDGHGGEALLALGLGILTLGASVVGGVTAPRATVTELRLESAEGVAVDTASLLAVPTHHPR